MWMGIFWTALGVFFLIQGNFVIPSLGINLGWIVIALGLFRVWWWRKTEYEPQQRRLQVRRELRELEQQAAKEQKEWEAELETSQAESSANASSEATTENNESEK